MSFVQHLVTSRLVAHCARPFSPWPLSLPRPPLGSQGQVVEAVLANLSDAGCLPVMQEKQSCVFMSSSDHVLVSEMWPFAPNFPLRPCHHPFAHPSTLKPHPKPSLKAMAHVHPIPFPPAPVPHQPSPLSFGFAFPCGTHGFGSTSSPSAPPAAGPSSTFGSPLRRPQPQTAFSSPSFPVNGQVSPSVGFGFGSPAAGGSTSRPTAQFQRHSSTGSPTVNRRRGRDDLSDEDEDEQDQRDQREFERARPMRGMKKSKVDPFGTVPSSSATSGPSVASTPSSSSSQASNEEPDLGVLLGACPAFLVCCCFDPVADL